MEIYLILKNS